MLRCDLLRFFVVAASFWAAPVSADSRVDAVIDQALAALDAESRAILSAYYLDGRKLAEIGRMLGFHEATASRKLDRQESLFPGYLFIRLNPRTDDWQPIRSTRGVSQIVRFNDQPLPVADDIIEALRERLATRPLAQAEDRILPAGPRGEPFRHQIVHDAVFSYGVA